MKRLILIFIASVFIFVGCDALENGDNYAYEGVLKSEDGEYLEAVEDLKKAIELGVDEYDLQTVHTILGNVYLELDMYEKSISEHKKAIEIDDKFYKAWVNIGIAYRQSGEFDLAEEAYSVAIDLNPDYAQLRSSLGTLYMLKEEPEKAIEEFELAIKLDPSISVIYGNAALAYAMIGDFDKAESYLEKAKLLGYENYDVIQERIDSLR